jgi:hypothetical protein
MTEKILLKRKCIKLKYVLRDFWELFLAGHHRTKHFGGTLIFGQDTGCKAFTTSYEI